MPVMPVMLDKLVKRSHLQLWNTVALMLMVAVFAPACGEKATPAQPTPPVTVTPPPPPPPPVAPKLTAPKGDSPEDDKQLDTQQPDLRVINGTSDKSGAKTYRFEVSSTNAFNDPLAATEAGIAEGADDKTTWKVNRVLPLGARFWWRARVEQEGASSDWSEPLRFKSKVDGFLNAGELWDPLTNGRTEGQPTGISFIAGVGARLDAQSSNIRYDMGRTMESGEHSMVITNVGPGNDGDKTKLLSQMEGGGDITDNDYRFTVEHRGRKYTDPGQIRIRMITGDSGNHSRINDSDKLDAGLRDEGTYFVRVRWGNGRISLFICEGNDDRGRVRLDYSMGYNGTYRPVPHIAFAGAPVGRNGPIDASIPGMIVRNVYVGPGPRPQGLGSALAPE